MNKVIDINDIKSYPTQLIHLFENQENDINYDEIFHNYYFKCCHLCCTGNIENYIKYGIMRPYIVNKDHTQKINYDLKKILLKPFEKFPNFKLYLKRYDEQLEKEYQKNKSLVNDWYGKYSCICYVLGQIDICSPAYEPIVNLYGGEMLRDIGISEQVLEELGSKLKSYLIYFKLSYFEVNEKCISIPEVVEYMRKIYINDNNEKLNSVFENNINKDIPHEDFINIVEVKKND